MVTWKSASVAVQLVLHRNGAIDFVYDRVGYPPVHGQRGIFQAQPLRSILRWFSLCRNQRLQGIDCMDEGAAALEVPVKFNDEIGRLTSNFNRMTRSFQMAQRELADYAQPLKMK